MIKYKIISIDRLIPLEKVFATHLKNLEEMINNDNFLLKAIIADKKTGTIMDGSHRYVYLLKNGYKEAPVYWADYDDEDVRVGTNLSHRFFVDSNTGITKDECRQRSLENNLFLPRTTRHFFPFRKVDISLPLDQLKKGTPVDVQRLISDADVSEEIEHNKEYINEINGEVEIVIQYLEEVLQTKKYLLKQIDHMNMTRDVVFFPGKFHPPHIGHIQTILNILPKYRKVIIGVSEDVPSDKTVINPDDIIFALKSFFITFDNVEVCKITGILSNKKSVDGLPDFDVLLSGNEKVLSWANKFNIKSEYISRSDGTLFSGTEIRKEL
jgi:nicotinamide mononucleotide adenylyltransferase